ncbi:hypothetical protein GW916_05975 [bacterium]|nr:hypothetical protein [bacterium]
MGAANSTSSLSLRILIGLICVACFLSGFSASAASSRQKSWELSFQSFDDELQMEQNFGSSIPLKARGNGFLLGYNNCFKDIERHCLHFNGSLGFGTANIQSSSSSYTYEDNGASYYQGLLGLGFKYRLPKSLATALLSGDIEVRKSSYRAPGSGYSIDKENLTIHYWIKAQFSFPLSSKVSFNQSLLFSPTSPDVSYRLGLSL